MAAGGAKTILVRIHHYILNNYIMSIPKSGLTIFKFSYETTLWSFHFPWVSTCPYPSRTLRPPPSPPHGQLPTSSFYTSLWLVGHQYCTYRMIGWLEGLHFLWLGLLRRWRRRGEGGVYYRHYLLLLSYHIFEGFFHATASFAGFFLLDQFIYCFICIHY